jgi:D-alanyl-D-alanine carboxypeptidase
MRRSSATVVPMQMRPLDDLAAGVPGTVLASVGDETWVTGDLDARYPIYSMTKPVIAFAVLDLARRGALALDDPAPLGWPGTIRQLLNHTSGARDYATLPAYEDALRARPGRGWTDDELLAAARAPGPDFAPGEGWAYSNTGYTLLRILLDDHGGLEAFLPRVGLERAAVAEAPDDLLTVVPAPWALPGEQASDVRGRYDPRWVGHRTLIASARDLLPFWRSLPPEMLDPVTFLPIGRQARGFVDPRYGLGVMADPGSPLGTVVGHGGGGPGYAHGVFTVPERHAIAIVLTADQRFDAQGTALHLLEAALAA